MKTITSSWKYEHVFVDSESVVLKNGETVFSFISLDNFSQTIISASFAKMNGPVAYVTFFESILKILKDIKPPKDKIIFITDMPEEDLADDFFIKFKDFELICSADLCRKTTQVERDLFRIHPIYNKMLSDLEQDGGLYFADL